MSGESTKQPMYCDAQLARWPAHCFVWSVELYATETWTLTKADRKWLEAFEVLIWRWLLRISWKDKITNASVLKAVSEERRMLNTIWQ